MINAPSIDAMTYAPQTTVGTGITGVSEDMGYDLGIIDTVEETNTDVIDLGTKTDDDLSNGEVLGKSLKNTIKDTFKSLFTNKEGKFSIGKTALLGATVAFPFVAGPLFAATLGALPLAVPLACGISGAVQVGAAVKQALKQDYEG